MAYLLGELPFKDLLLNRTRAEHAVEHAALLLPVAPHTRGRLLVVGRVPIGVEEDEPVAADEVEAAPAGLGREQEGKQVGVGVVELLDHRRACDAASRGRVGRFGRGRVGRV